jgi:hypothetical protein
MSSDLGGREIVVTGAGNAGASVTAGNPIDFTETKDTTSSWDGSTFTVPETGEYSVEGAVFLGSAASQTINLAVGGANIGSIGGKSTTSTLHFFSGSASLVKGDLLTIEMSATSTLSNSSLNHHVHIKKLASPQTVLETETVAARYTTDSGQSIADNDADDIVIYEDVVRDTHNAMNTGTGVYTIPVSGWYSIDAKVTWLSLSVSAGTQFRLEIAVGGVRTDFARNTSQGSTTGVQGVSCSTTLYLTKDETVDIRAFQNTGGAETLNSNGDENTFSIARIK